MNDTSKVDALKLAIEKYNREEITRDELEVVAKAAMRKVNIWDNQSERNPLYPVGFEISRVGFSYDPKHPKGRYFEKIIKKVMWKTIEYVHKKMLKYDENIFIFDDARLAACQDFWLAFIDTNASHSAARAELYGKALNLFLGLQKEDLRYRALFFQGYNEFVKVHKRFELTAVEEDNIKRWH